jgi:hypothetical protein
MVTVRWYTAYQRILGNLHYHGETIILGNLIFTIRTSDFAQWHQVFQSREALRLAEGIHETGIYRSISDEQAICLAP